LGDDRATVAMQETKPMNAEAIRQPTMRRLRRRAMEEWRWRTAPKPGTVLSEPVRRLSAGEVRGAD